MKKTRIVLVHGIFNTGHILLWMKWKLQKAGFECISPSLWPFDGRKGIKSVANQLKQKINQRFGETDKLTIIGFSMGGIVARYYLQELGGAQRTENFISIASPHHGSYWSYFPYPSIGVKQLRPGSQFLKNLESSESNLKDINLYSYWTPFETCILPASSCVWRVAKNIKLYALHHLTIIFNRKMIREIIAIAKSV